MKLGIYGAGGLGREVLVLAQMINQPQRWEAIFFIDDITAENVISGIPVVRFSEVDFADSEIVIALGEPGLRQTLMEKVTANGRLATLIHPQVLIPKQSDIGAGTIICSGAFISCDVNIGANVLIQPLACVGHDCVIREHSVISSNVTLAGHCHIGQRVFIGMNSAVKEQTSIGDDAIIGMGSAVFGDIAEASIALGNPARVMRKNEQLKVFK